MKDEDGTQLAERFEQVTLNDEVDEKLGFPRLQEGVKKEGWLVNMRPVRAFASGNATCIANIKKDALT